MCMTRTFHNHRSQINLWRHEEEKLSRTTANKDKQIKARTQQKATRTRGYKTFFMLNSTEHEITTAYKN